MRDTSTWVYCTSIHISLQNADDILEVSGPYMCQYWIRTQNPEIVAHIKLILILNSIVANHQAADDTVKVTTVYQGSRTKYFVIMDCGLQTLPNNWMTLGGWWSRLTTKLGNQRPFSWIGIRVFACTTLSLGLACFIHIVSCKSLSFKCRFLK